MKYKYYIGGMFVCEASTKVKFDTRFSAVREEVEETKKKSTVETEEATDEINSKEEQ